MTRNHFSKKGGPYFVNDGFTHHTDKPQSPKPDMKVLYRSLVRFGIVLVTIAVLLLFI